MEKSDVGSILPSADWLLLSVVHSGLTKPKKDQPDDCRQKRDHRQLPVLLSIRFLIALQKSTLTDILLFFLLIIPCRNTLSNFSFLPYLYVKQVVRNPIHLRHCPGTRHADVHAAPLLSHLSLESPE